MQCHMEAWERVKYIIENEGYNKNSFSNEIGLRNNATIGRLINEHRTPSGSVFIFSANSACDIPACSRS